jgi:hypothetical protein
MGKRLATLPSVSCASPPPTAPAQAQPHNRPTTYRYRHRTPPHILALPACFPTQGRALPYQGTRRGYKRSTSFKHLFELDKTDSRDLRPLTLMGRIAMPAGRTRHEFHWHISFGGPHTTLHIATTSRQQASAPTLEMMSVVLSSTSRGIGCDIVGQCQSVWKRLLVTVTGEYRRYPSRGPPRGKDC